VKPSLLDRLCCPTCHGSLHLDAALGRDDVEEGLVRCEGCHRSYPVINGVPRLLTDALMPMVAAHHPEFFARHRGTLGAHAHPGRAEARADRAVQAKMRTITSYSYQWRKFCQMLPHWEDVFRWAVDPIEPAFFRGKTGLDAGCGFGRSLFYAASYGADVIGLDLSEAVESARANTRHLAGAHVVQGDLSHPPVRPHTLDFVYSIGVLQHLPDPAGGFHSLTRLLAPSAPMIVWVYSRGRGRQIAAFTAMRALTTRLPPKVNSALALMLAIGQTALWIGPARALAASPVTRALARHVPFALYARYPFRVLHADWLDGLSVPIVNYYKPASIAAWYEEAGLERVRIAPDWKGRALGYARAARV
jgi:uncharacterized protein YbaR (Trm112 family)/SAM-dependent methyltransferase